MRGLDVLAVMDRAAGGLYPVNFDGSLEVLAARAAVNELLKSSAEIKFDLYELTTPELQAAFDGQKRIAVVQIDSLKKFRAALAAITTTPESN